VQYIGVQDEKVFVETSSARLASLGIDPSLIVDSLQATNIVAQAGVVEAGEQRVALRVTGEFDSVEAIADIGIHANDRMFRLGDIARVYRGYVDPVVSKMHYNGRDAIGVAIAMRAGGDVIRMGKDLDAAVARLRAAQPVGVEIHAVSNQPAVVKASVHEFTTSLLEAIVIVLAVSFLSLGWRTGIVVALSIPLVLAMTFLAMYILGIDLQRISLGALIIALGLLVDDAIIAVEMMALKLEQGWDRVSAATHAYTATAFPMLTGTLITAAGFLPVGMAKSSAGEYTISIFQVVGIALILSWVVAVLFTPYLGYKLLPEMAVSHGHSAHGVNYERGFYARFRRLLEWCLRRRGLVLGCTLAMFIGAMGLFKAVPQQFFPASSRPELMVDLQAGAQAATRPRCGRGHRLHRHG
jgi:multidrug efflux pump